eukprot:gb/GEZN01017101.1/.p1 GENE.gb/GEZN01017101.1/~~gb/GEZN01017101.1/.p1  ORF type:complete len:243 (-),score=27.31 gb/GEZN01017101.1/:85-765(-)
MANAKIKVLGMVGAAACGALLFFQLKRQLRQTAAKTGPKEWKVFLDLQCPYSKICLEQHYEELKSAFGEYKFSIVLTSLVFHPQAFPAQKAVFAMNLLAGEEARYAYINKIYAEQDRISNAKTSEMTRHDIDGVLADIAAEAGLVKGKNNESKTGSPTITREALIGKMNDFDNCVKPAYAEHKIALAHKVYGVPKHVIAGQLIEDSESSWGVKEFHQKMRSLGLTS